MKLPNLSDLDLDSDLKEYEDDNSNKKKSNQRKKKSSQKKTSKENLPKVNLPSEVEEKDIKKETKREKPKVPKSQYDAEGNPILTIPDLDDVDLTSEIDRFFGKEDD